MGVVDRNNLNEFKGQKLIATGRTLIFNLSLKSMTMMLDTKKSINVVATLIEQDGKVFAAQRAYGELKGKWEFPGGKIENGETPQEALKREIKEELDTEIEVGGFFMHIDYEYPTFFLHMDVFRATPLKERLEIETEPIRTKSSSNSAN